MSKHSQLMQTRALLSIGVLLLLSLASCSTPTTNTTSHKTYNYANFVAPAADNLSPGDQITLTWKPTPGPDSTEATPTHQTISAELYGPFSSLTALNEAVNQSSCSAVSGNVMAQITPIQTDDWTNKTYTSTLPLPQSLTAGYYALIQKVSLSGNGNGGCSWTQSVVEIKAK
jgi:hypothetical protein